MSKIKSICPNCGGLAEVMASCSPDYNLIECHNVIEKIINKKKINEYHLKQPCGFRTFVKKYNMKGGENIIMATAKKPVKGGKKGTKKMC